MAPLDQADLDYMAHIQREAARFADVLASTDPQKRVPTCPDWSAQDLLWHLAEVHLFWAEIVADRLQDPDEAEARKPERPADLLELLALMRAATLRLLNALAATPDETEIWTWGVDQNVAFVRRWQAHEALIHRLDAELTAGSVSDIDPDLATDGIDAVLRISYSWMPPWATFASSGVLGRIEATDTGGAWAVELGRFTGTSPNTGKTYDDPVLRVLDQSELNPGFVVQGDAATVDAWLWRREIGPVEISGDPAAYEHLERVLANGVQ